MRVACAAAIFFALQGCGSANEDRQSAAPSSGAAAVDAAEAAPECALAGAEAWRRDCAMERDGAILTLRHPDGGFRRFKMLNDGRGLESADGAEEAKLTILDDRRIEVAVGADRYRLPARIAAAQ